MKVKNRNYFNHSTNKHILKTASTLCQMPIKKDVTFKKKLKSVKIFVPPTDENDLYGLKNKIVERKPILKRHVDNTAFIKRKVLKTRNKIPKTFKSMKEGNVKKEILKEINKNESLNTSKTSLNTSRNYPKRSKNVTSMSFVNCKHPNGYNASEKLKILEMYYQLKSFDIISDITGVNMNTLRYWKKTEDSIRKKADKDNLADVSHSQIDFNSMIAEVKNEILLNKELPKRGRPKSSTILDQSLRPSQIDDIASDPEIIHSSSKKALESTESMDFFSKSYLFENNVQVPSPKRGRPRRSVPPNMFFTRTNESNINRNSKTSAKQLSDDPPLIESPKKGRPRKSLILNHSMMKSPIKRYVFRASNQELTYNSSKTDSPAKRGRKKSIIINSCLKNFPIRNKKQSPSPIELQMKKGDVKLAVSSKKRGRKGIHHFSKLPIRTFVLQEKNQEQRAKSPSIRDHKTDSPKKRGRKISLISNHFDSKPSPIADNKTDSPKKRGRKKSVLSNYLVSTPASQNKVNEQGYNISSIDVQFPGEDISIGSPKKRGRKKSLLSNLDLSESPTKISVVRELRAKSSLIVDNKIDSSKKRGRKKSLLSHNSIVKSSTQTPVVQEKDQEQHKQSSPIGDNKTDSPKKRGRKKSLPPNYSVNKPSPPTIVHDHVDISIDSLKKRGRKKSLNLDSTHKTRDIRGKLDDYPSPNDIKHHDTDGRLESPKKKGRKKSSIPNLSKSPIGKERKVLSAKRSRSRKFMTSSEIVHQIDSPKKRGRKKSSNCDMSKSSNGKHANNKTMDDEQKDQVNPESPSDRKKIPNRKLKSREVFSKTAKKSIADSLKKTRRPGTVKSILSPNKSSITKQATIRIGDMAHKTDLVDKSNTRKRLTSSEKNSRFIPQFKGIDDIVDEINKLSCIYDSSNCLNFLNDHFKLLSSEPVSTKSYDNTSIVAKTKLQDETFKNIISDFFYGEYKLLMEINHQFNQLSQKKYKNINKNLEELKNYFSGSIQRLQVLKQQLS